MLVKEGVDFEEGQHTSDKIFNATTVIKSPGIPDHVAMIMELKEKGIEVVSEIEWASRLQMELLLE
jgi:UDP-N-acetylmuramoylalanine--D-glutamate ligase